MRVSPRNLGPAGRAVLRLACLCGREHSVIIPKCQFAVVSSVNDNWRVNPTAVLNTPPHSKLAI